MRIFIDNLTERNFQNRTVAFIENGSWAPTAMKIMKKSFENSKKITFADNNVSIMSAVNEETEESIRALADELAAGYGPVVVEEDNRINPSALFKIGYGLYVVTARDGEKDNGQIVNTVTQVSDKPNRIAVNINKVNYTCEMINKTGRLNVCVLSEEAPFKVFEHFGFQSGRDVDKFADFKYVERASNGVLFLDKYANAYISGKVVDKVDLGTHTMFICE